MVIGKKKKFNIVNQKKYQLFQFYRILTVMKNYENLKTAKITSCDVERSLGKYKKYTKI